MALSIGILPGDRSSSRSTPVRVPVQLPGAGVFGQALGFAGQPSALQNRAFGALQGARDQIGGLFQDFGQSRRAEIEQGFETAQNNLLAGLEARGLSGSNLAPVGGFGLEGERQTALGELADQLLGQEIGATLNLAGQESGAFLTSAGQQSNLLRSLLGDLGQESESQSQGGTGGGSVNTTPSNRTGPAEDRFPSFGTGGGGSGGGGGGSGGGGGGGQRAQPFAFDNPEFSGSGGGGGAFAGAARPFGDAFSGLGDAFGGAASGVGQPAADAFGAAAPGAASGAGAMAGAAAGAPFGMPGAGAAAGGFLGNLLGDFFGGDVGPEGEDEEDEETEEEKKKREEGQLHPFTQSIVDFQNAINQSLFGG